MLQLKKRKAYFLMWMVCICLCACSGEGEEVILIGAQESSQAVETADSEDLAEVGKKRREEIEHTDEMSSEAVGVENDAVGSIRVYVCGAVEESGVVEIPADSRVEDALEAAGGFAENANHTCVNLAAWVTDGQMLYFPTEDETDAESAIWNQAQISEILSASTEQDGLININTAGVEQLCTLPGIGEKRAADIIAYREENGFFEKCEDIMCVPGIKNGLYEKIRDKIIVK